MRDPVSVMLAALRAVALNFDEPKNGVEIALQKQVIEAISFAEQNGITAKAKDCA